MNVRILGTQPDGTLSVEIRCDESSYHALLRCIRKLPGAIVSDATHDPMNDDARAHIRYRDIEVNLQTPFSDYVLDCTSASATFDEFVASLREHQVRWWERWP